VFLCFECSIGGPKEQEIRRTPFKEYCRAGFVTLFPIATLRNGTPDQREAAERAGKRCEDHLRSSKLAYGLLRFRDDPHGHEFAFVLGYTCPPRVPRAM